MRTGSASSTNSLAFSAAFKTSWSRTRRMPSAAPATLSITDLPSQWSSASAVSHAGVCTRTSLSGNSNSSAVISPFKSSSDMVCAFTARTGTPYCSLSVSRSFTAAASEGFFTFNITINGLPSALSSVTTRASAAS